MLLTFSLFFACLTFYHVSTLSSFVLSLDLFYSYSFVISMTLFSSFYSSLFSFSVSFIAFVVFLFIMYYMHSCLKLSYFMWLTFLFVSSMLILINFSDLFFVILGWDGLGVVSFFLILFYQNSSSLLSASFTLIINRLGDALLVLSILLFISHSSFLAFVFSSPLSLSVCIVLVFGLITNSALFPFSPWLPAAIAAPTPISSLVHSSTLVTAGLYLIMRNFCLISSFPFVLNFLAVVGLFTSFYAGLSSLLEVDTNNVVALSTLSHLGFISFSLGLGWCSLAFIHLLSHAFFNSSLFVGVGSFISNYSHYQDSRYFSSFALSLPFPSSVILVSEANLLGLPFLSGFYSKDLVLESFFYSYFSYFLVLVVWLNLVFTFLYAFRIINSLLSTPNFNSLSLLSIEVNFFSSLLCFISLFSVFFSSYALSYFINLTPFFVPSCMNFLPIIILFSVFFFYLLSLSEVFTFSFSLFFLSSIVFLAPVWTKFISYLSTFSYNYSRSVEIGGFHYLVVSYPINLVLNTSILFSYLYNVSYIFSINYSLFLILFSCLVYFL